MDILNRAALLEAASAASCPQETVEVPEFGGAVIVRGMSGAQMAEFDKAVMGPIDGDKPPQVDQDLFAPMLLVHCLVDEKGSRLLKDSDLPKVKAWPASAFRRLATIAMRLNGFTEDAAGNSPETVNGASISA